MQLKSSGELNEKQESAWPRRTNRNRSRNRKPLPASKLHSCQVIPDSAARYGEQKERGGGTIIKGLIKAARWTPRGDEDRMGSNAAV